MINIIIANAISGCGVILLVSIVFKHIDIKCLSKFLAFPVGILLGMSFIHLIPEAIEQVGHDGHQAHLIWVVLTVSIVGFFLIERVSIWTHKHEELECHIPHLHLSPTVIIVGDSIHNFIDGIIIASAFMVNNVIGITTTLAIVAHEIPQEISDFICLRSMMSFKSALKWNIISSIVSIIGGIIGYVLITLCPSIVSYLLMISAASFIYIAMSDLLPFLHTQRTLKSLCNQLLLISIGIGIAIISASAHTH
jgi:zinc and cadmium transporter